MQGKLSYFKNLPVITVIWLTGVFVWIKVEILSKRILIWSKIYMFNCTINGLLLILRIQWVGGDSVCVFYGSVKQCSHFSTR